MKVLLVFLCGIIVPVISAQTSAQSPSSASEMSNEGVPRFQGDA